MLPGLEIDRAGAAAAEAAAAGKIYQSRAYGRERQDACLLMTAAAGR